MSSFRDDLCFSLADIIWSRSSNSEMAAATEGARRVLFHLHGQSIKDSKQSMQSLAILLSPKLSNQNARRTNLTRPG